MSAAHNTYDIGASGIPVDSTLAGKNVNESYLAIKTFSRIVLSNVDATQLPNCPCGYAYVFNPLGNDIVYVGGLDAVGDTPYPDPNFPYLGRGQPIYPGNGKRFRVADVNLLQAISSRNGDQISVTGYLSQADFTTPTNDPPPDPNSLPALIAVSTFPVNGATAVPINTIANVLMLRSIDPTTVNLTNVTVAPAVGGLTVYVDPTTPAQIDIDPHGSNLAFNTAYTITITTAVKDTQGAAVKVPIVFSFTTAAAPPPPDTDPPVVSSVTPVNAATGIAVSVHPVIVMGEAIVPAGVTTTNVVLKNQNGQALATTVSVAGDNKTITIVPTSTLANSNTHTISVANLQDPEGNTMTPFSSTFTTVAAAYVQIYNSSGTVANNLGAFSPFDTGDGIRIGTGSMLVGHTPHKFVTTLKKISSAAGNVYCYHLDSSLNIKAQLGNTLSGSSISTAGASYSFETAANTTKFVVGDWIGIYGQVIGGNIAVFHSTTNTVDGTKTYRSRVSSPPNAYINDTSTDFAATIYE